MLRIDLLNATAHQLQDDLNAKAFTSVQLLEACLARIEKYDSYLKSIISIVPRNLLLQRATLLDEERQAGRVRSPLHGLPILIKDNISTDIALGCRTTVGNFAFEEATVTQNAPIVERLLDAGLILLGKANLSELGYFKGTGIPCGWSAVGGQTQSPYVRGGYKANDSVGGHSNCGGSSSGSAVAVAAGFVPFAIGTEVEGSLTMPSTRAALYTLKSTPGIIPEDGIAPVCPLAESAGPMTKCVRDLVEVWKIISTPSATIIHDSLPAIYETSSFSDIKIAAVDPEKWRFDEVFVRPVHSATVQMENEIKAAYKILKSHAKAFFEDAELPSLEKLEYNGVSALSTVFKANYRKCFDEYLPNFESTPVHSMKELVAWNNAHAENELPKGYEAQDVLEDSSTFTISPDEYAKTFAHMRYWGRSLGIDHVLDSLQADVLIGPADSELTQFSSAGGYPLATLPLGCLDYNGRPFGLVAICRQYQEHTLMRVQAAWEATFPPRRTPPEDLNCPKS